MESLSRPHTAVQEVIAAEEKVGRRKEERKGRKSGWHTGTREREGESKGEGGKSQEKKG